MIDGPRTMRFVNNQNEHDPAANLALEEYVLRNAQMDEDLLLLYINEPSIIIGRHQNLFEEINRDYVEQHGIHVVRRLSGGGTVYHDLGNLNFSFITEALAENFRNFKKFTAPVIRALAELGVPAELNGRNDLLIDGRKISGTAQYISKGRMVSHGTLLFNADLSHVTEALHVQEGQFSSKAIRSVRSRVTNICDFLSQPMDIETFKGHLLAQIFPGAAPIPEYTLGVEDWAAVRKMADERFRGWEWTYGHSPDFSVEKRKRFLGGEVVARLDIQQGLIRSVTFSGDFFAHAETSLLEQCLIGARYNPSDISHALQRAEFGRNFSDPDVQAFSKFLS
jgi:lipoate---protein ligase